MCWLSLEEHTCLWDIYSNDYTKRKVKENAFTELAEHFWDNVSEFQI